MKFFEPMDSDERFWLTIVFLGFLVFVIGMTTDCAIKLYAPDCPENKATAGTVG